MDAVGLVGLVVAVEVVGVEEEKYAAAGLIADEAGLFGSVGFGEQKGGAAGIWGSDEKPAFFVGKRSVLQQVEAEFLCVELQGFVIISYEKSHTSDGLGHGRRLLHCELRIVNGPNLKPRLR
jgi:hypothetical protein